MKITYVTADHGTPLFGGKGASIHIRELVNGYAGNGHEIAALAARVGERVWAARRRSSAGAPTRPFPVS